MIIQLKFLLAELETDSLPSVKLFPETEYVEVENHAVMVPSSGKNNFIITRNQVEKENKIIIEGEVRSGKVLDVEKNTEKLSLPRAGKIFSYFI